MLRFLFFVCVLAVPPFFASQASAQLTHDQFDNLIKTVRWLESKHIHYREKVFLPGERKPWVMDCSNTVRYICKDALGIELPRVASGQYWKLDQAGKITPAPLIGDRVNTDRLLDQMASGDLLFWEWTYNIKRTPPITHVMIYLGKDKNGVPQMAGSSSRKNGGIAIYPFNPNAPMGGVRSIWGGYSKKARFVGFGRLLEMTDHTRSVATFHTAFQ